MSSAIDFKLTGFGSPEGRCLPCSGLSGRAVNSFGEYKHIPKVKLNLRSPYKSTFFECNASSSSHRRNPEFSRQNKHVYSRNRNRQNEDRYGNENLEESEMLSSKNGPLLTISNTSKFQPAAAPGPREKEIVELFRKVQAQLREKAANKEEKKSDELQGKGKESETVDSLLKLLRKHSVQKGKKISSSDFVLDQPDQSSVISEDRAGNILELNSSVNHEAKSNGTPVFNRLKSNFQRRSPVSRIKFQPVHHEEGTDNPVAPTSMDKKEKELHLEPGLRHISKSKVDSVAESDTEPIFLDEDVLDEMPDDDRAKMYENVIDDDDEQNQVEHDELAEMKLTELRVIAKSRGLKGYSKLKKIELIGLLSAGQV